MTERSPLALLEAMAARVQVVATSVGAIPEIVRHEESALLVPPRDPAARLGCEPCRRWERAARELMGAHADRH